MTNTAKGKEQCCEMSLREHHKCWVVHTEIAAGLLEQRLLILKVKWWVRGRIEKIVMRNTHISVIYLGQIIYWWSKALILRLKSRGNRWSMEFQIRRFWWWHLVILSVCGLPLSELIWSKNNLTLSVKILPLTTRC